MSEPELWVLTGGNGAGKSTFFRLMLGPTGLPFVNADELAREYYPEDPEGRSYDAAKLAEVLRNDLLARRWSFCFETVFSHPSKIDFLAEAKAAGYRIVLVYIHLERPELNLARVAQRVSTGGHSVPDAKVVARLPRTLANVGLALPLCDEVHVLDNSSAQNPYVQVLTLKNGLIVRRLNPLPSWAQATLCLVDDIGQH